MKVYILNGVGTAGKQEFFNWVQQIAWERDTILITQTSIIDPIKLVAYRSFIWDGEKKDKKSRKLLYNLKCVLDEYNDFSYQETKKQIDFAWKSNCKAIFIDVREPKDIQRFVNDYRAKTILIKRDGIDIWGNPADDNVEKYNYDFIIENNGTLKELHKKAEDFYTKEILEEN